MSEQQENKDQSELHTFILEVSNKMGVHARPAAMIVRITSRYEGDIWVTKDDERINAKSIMGMMSLSLIDGEELAIVTNGADEEVAADGLVKFFAKLK